MTDKQKNIENMIGEALEAARKNPRPATARALAELAKCGTVAELRKLAEGVTP